MNKIFLVLLVISSQAMAENVYDAACRDDFKFTPGTEAFSNCVLQLTIEGNRALQAEKAQAQAADAERRALAAKMFPIRPYVQTYNYQMPVPAYRQPVRCQWLGNVWTCN